MAKIVLFVLALSSVFVISSSTPGNPAMAPYLSMIENVGNSDEYGQAVGTSSTTCSCGWTNKARIVGGVETKRNEYPLIAALVEKGKRDIFCGGSIITERHVLTAAHCTQNRKQGNFSIVVGEHDQSEDTSKSGAQIIEVKNFIEHENFNHDSFLYDIALLILQRKIEFNQVIGPACMPAGPMKLTNEQVKVIGWGATSNDGPVSKVLLKANLKLIPIQACADSYAREILVQNPHQICSFLRTKDSCQGDSGGPMIWLDPATNRYTLVGLVSYGLKCGKKSPSVNTDVSYFLKWINDKIQATDKSVKTCTRT